MLDELSKKKLNSEQAYEVCRWLGEQIDLAKVANRKIPLPRPFSTGKMVTDRLVFFPGSFNPWHYGHRECLIKCPDGPIAIIPDRNPWKDVFESNPWDEISVIKEQVLRLEREDVFIDPAFLAKKEPNPTVTWLPHVNVQEKWLLMGDDLFLGLHRWQNFEKILECLTGIYVCPRLGNKVELTIQKESLLKIADLDIVFLEHHDYEDLSSTKLRK